MDVEGSEIWPANLNSKDRQSVYIQPSGQLRNFPQRAMALSGSNRTIPDTTLKVLCLLLPACFNAAIPATLPATSGTQQGNCGLHNKLQLEYHLKSRLLLLPACCDATVISNLPAILSTQDAGSEQHEQAPGKLVVPCTQLSLSRHTPDERRAHVVFVFRVVPDQSNGESRDRSLSRDATAKCFCSSCVLALYHEQDCHY